METAALLFGFGGVFVNFAWPLYRRRQSMLLAQALGAALFALHYGLLGAATATIVLILAGTQALVAIPLGTDPRFRGVYIATLPLIAGALALSWQGWPSLFAALGFTMISLGRYQVNVVAFRAFLVGCVPFWVVHNLMVGSIPGLFSDAVSISSGIWMLVVEIRRQRAGVLDADSLYASSQSGSA